MSRSDSWMEVKLDGKQGETTVAVEEQDESEAEEEDEHEGKKDGDRG